MRHKLASFLHQEVEFTAHIGKFSKNERDETILLLRNLTMQGMLIARHIWLREVPAYVERRFHVGDMVSFQAKVKWYERAGTGKEDYGIKNAKKFTHVEVDDVTQLC